jgi:ATP-dependent DNA helicase RecG
MPFALARSAARRAARGVRPRALVAATAPAVAALSNSAALLREGCGAAAAPAPVRPFGAAARPAFRAASASAQTVLHRGAGVQRAADGTPAGAGPPAADPSVLVMDIDTAKKQFEAAAAWECANGYDNSLGNKFPNFGTFLCDVLDRVARAREASGQDASTLRRARQDAERYGAMRSPQRLECVVRVHVRAHELCCTSVAFCKIGKAEFPRMSRLARTQVKCAALLDVKHDPPVPLGYTQLGVTQAGTHVAAATRPPKAAAALPQRPPVPLGGGLKSTALPAASTPDVSASAPVPTMQRGRSPPAGVPKRPSAPLGAPRAQPTAPCAQPAAQAAAPMVFAFDLETTGFDANTQRIIEVAVVDCETGDAFETLVNPGHMRVPARVTELTSINTSMVRAPEVPGFALAAELMELHVAKCASRRRDAPILLVAHNSRMFDVRFLVAEYERVGRALPEEWRFVDTLPLAQALVRDSANHKLAVLRDHFKLDGSGAHRAAADAHMVRDLLGPRALGGLEPNLPAVLLREAFRAVAVIRTPTRSTSSAASAAAVASPEAAAAAQALLEAADEADDDVCEGEVDQDSSGMDAGLVVLRKSKGVARRPAASASAGLPFRLPPRPDPLFGMQAQFEGAPLAQDAPQPRNGDWLDTPLSACLSAADADLLGHAFGSVEQLLRRYPSRYDEFEPFHVGLAEGSQCMAAGVVTSITGDDSVHVNVQLQTRQHGVCTATLRCGPDTDESAAVLLNMLQLGCVVTLRGEFRAGCLAVTAASQVLDRPAGDDVGREMHAAKVVPSWPPLTASYGSGVMLSNDCWARALDAALLNAEDTQRRRGDWLECLLGRSELARLGLVSGAEALRALHQPTSHEQVVVARRRLAFEELFLLQVSLLRSRAALLASKTAPRCTSTEAVDSILDALSRRSWQLTPGQRSALSDVLSDMASAVPMLRLLTGDVGCGKSVVAFLALLTAHDAGVQGVLLASTDGQASELFMRLQQLLEDAGVAPARRPTVVLLSKNMSAAERQSCLAALQHGDVAARAHIVIGAHSLIAASDVTFAKLGLVVVDDEQRFDAAHREALRSITADGTTPHVLTLTDTPLPRVLALAAYGDSAISLIAAKPPGQEVAVTTKMHPYDAFGAVRAAALADVHAEVTAGGRACVAYPPLLTDPSESPAGCITAAAAHAQLCGPGGALSGLSVGLLHAALSGDAKAAVIAAFAAGDTTVLLASAELLLDAPQATLLVVEHAELFGLAELHRLRSRVGRGARAARCVLLHGEGTARLEVLVEHADGVRIAEEDLRHGGSDTLLGDAQRSLLAACLSLASLTDDAELLDAAREAAARLLMGADDDDDRRRSALSAALQSRNMPQPDGAADTHKRAAARHDAQPFV